MTVEARQRKGRPVSFWTPERCADLAAAYAEGGITEARRRFPDHSRGSLSMQASKLGCNQRRPRRTLKSVVPLVAPPPPSPQRPKVVLREGTCEPGEVEHIQTRMEFVIAGLTVELRRKPEAVVDALLNLAPKRFARNHSAGIDPEAAYPPISSLPATIRGQERTRTPII